MAIIVSVLRLVKFQDCPIEGAHPVHMDDILTAIVLPPANTVLPVITGSLTPGSVLTTTTGTWTSTKPITYTYQWTKNGISIVNAILPVYVLTEADVGSSITVKVTATNMAGSSTVTAVGVDGTEPPPIYGLLNSELPKVTGTLKVGSTLTTDNGGWVGTPPPTFTYSWQRDDVDIPGATSNTYLLVTADAGHLITSGVTATNPADTLVAYSGAVGPISSPVANTAPPVISGVINVGSTLTATTGTWSGIPTPTYAYQWQRNGVNISGETSNTYVLVLADTGTMIRMVVTATNSNNSASAISNSLGPIINPLANTAPPVISGDLNVGSTLTAATGTWTGTPSPSFTYQWRRSGVNISGATSNSYLLVVADIGATITAVVTATNVNGNLSATSNSLGPVIPTVIALSGSTVYANASIGTVIGALSVSGGTGSYTYTLISNPSGQFAISGANLTVATALTAGSYPITIRATGGTPSPISTSFMLTVMVPLPPPVEGAWFNGLPIGIKIVANDVGSEKYWFNGLTDPILKD